MRKWVNVFISCVADGVLVKRYGRARTKIKRKKNAGRGGKEEGKEAKLKKTAFFTPPPPFPSFSRLTSAELSCGRIFYYKSHKRTTHTKTRFLRRLTCSLYRRYGRHIGIVIRAAKNIVSCPGDFTTGFVVSGFHSFVIYNCSSHI